jgi:hypothetical protein
VAGGAIVNETASIQRELWNNVEALLTTNYHQSDIQSVKVVLSTVAAHYLESYTTCWLMLIAPSGSLKTAILNALVGIPNFHMIDQVTPNTFISGKTDDSGPEGESKQDKAFAKAYKSLETSMPIRKTHEQEDTHRRIAKARQMTNPSLLHRIGETGIIALPDFSTILEMHESSRNVIFAQMRRLHDGSLRREFGTVSDTPGEREYHGRITFLAAVTPEVDNYHKMFSSLGDRFLRVRWPRSGGCGAMKSATRQDKAIPKALLQAIQSFIALAMTPRHTPVVPPFIEERTGNLSEFVCHARAHVHREKGEIMGEPSIESNTRLPQELMQVGRGWASLMGQLEVDEEAFGLMERVAWDCIPPTRRHVLECLRDGQPVYGGSQSSNGITRAIEELKAIGLVNKPDLAEARLTDFAKEMLAAVTPTTPYTPPMSCPPVLSPSHPPSGTVGGVLSPVINDLEEMGG